MRLMIKPLALTFLLVVGFAAVGCGADGAQEAGPLPTVPASSEPVPATETTASETAPESEAAPTTTAKAAPPPPASCGPQVGGEDGVYMNLKDVRVGAHNGFDRIVFEFKEPDPNPAGNGGIPRYEIRQAKPPFTEDPSDMPIDVEGDAFARIIFQGASGYDFDGNATYDGPRRLTPGFGTLAQVVEGGDFEATMTWLLGLSRPTCWQIQELHNPERLVIDFHHV
jgi:hypothetical protein